MKIVFVDEDADQRETFILTLQDCFPNHEESITVVGVEPKPKLSDMSFLVEDNEIVTVILDEQLKDSGVAQYFGIELASYLRALNRKIPIYILTSYPDSEELLEGEMTIEDILSKSELPKRKEIVGARILRRINNFLDITGEREAKFEELLRKSISGGMTEEEVKEFSELGYLRAAPFEVQEIIHKDDLIHLDSLEREIEEIEKRLEKKYE